MQTPRRGLVASGRRLRLDDRKQKPVKASKWQDAAWGYNDEIGFLKSTNNQVADASSRVRTFPAIAPDQGEDPIPIEEAVDNVEGVTQSFADAALAVYARIRNETGTIRELQRRAVLNLNVPGDCVLIGEEGIEGGESWQLHSSSALDWRGGKWWVRSGPTDRQGRELDPERTNIVHIMRPHGQWPDIPDSNMRGLLNACELLTFLCQGDLAVAQSRIANAGLLFISNDLEVPGLSAADYDGDSDAFTEWFGEMMMQSIGDPASSSSVVPGVVRADGKMSDNIEHLSFDRPQTEHTEKKMDATILYIARGLYAPPEWTLGIGESSTYATARVVDREGYLRYLDPTMLEWCAGLTTGWERPALLDMGFTPANSRVEDVCIWRDPSSILARAEPVVAKDKGTELLLTKVATINEIRGEYGWADTPDGDRYLTDDEIAILRKGQTPGVLQDPNEETNPNADAAIEASARLAITAGASPADRVAQKLGHIDRVLFDRLLALADKAIGNALNVAGAKLRTQASKSPFKDRVKGGVPAHMVALALGRGAIETMTNGDVPSLFGESLDRYHGDFDSITGRAQRQSRDAVLGLADDFDDTEIVQRQDDDRSAAWLIFAAALAGLAADRLLNPTSVDPPDGEFDPTLSVPGGVIRTAIAQAGGQTGLVTDVRGGITTMAGEPPAGVGTGPTIRDLARDALGMVFAGHVWTWGGAARPFEPHEALDGVFFETFADPVLAWDPGTFPFVEYLRISDHFGCSCSWANARLVEVA